MRNIQAAILSPLFFLLPAGASSLFAADQVKQENPAAPNSAVVSTKEVDNVPKPKCLCACPCENALHVILKGMPISKKKAASLLKAFRRAQYSQVKALAHQLKLALKGFELAETTRRKEWDQKQIKEKDQFYSEGHKPEERKIFTRDFLSRRKMMNQKFKDKITEKKKEHEKKVAELKKEQEEKLKRFKLHTDNEIQPPTDLWPGAAPTVEKKASIKKVEEKKVEGIREESF